ncbi:aldo-keto reductase superfamily protein KNAG_0C04110 [Huiozyma naganishii CBS 8797]|uniref:NADP-dependent oxidoreductase domain-containing protein n=1 Tax=Huiozyma naganishii (strain ATCC MYA-139 / BCRC 22969 / CBS 8797 / KCTC 17520 / NBRC 10181 / NCYC 3082 / Yp74L-3) TaxID=1071383 RepID=J7S4X3_HUIN7|nr:hypothetical protein KNAG_0C04110 [Kazachstania naganishii CBS 8797]CCK69514.1 hypothetical protein KNAG_0C04110 [Kazachstania naganishii CBS 8797]
MSHNQAFVTLNNGHKMPAVAIIGTGTHWHHKKEKDHALSHELIEQLEFALSLPGVVHIDAAEMYGTYPELSAALRMTEKPRSEIFITDKHALHAAMSKDPIAGLEDSLKANNLDYVDLYLLHSPFVAKEKPGLTLEGAWRQMEQLYKDGKAKNIGVSNFSVEDLKRVLSVAEIKPQVNQIEFHPFLQNQTPGILKFCQDENIELEAFTPLGPLQVKTQEDENDEFFKYISSLSGKYQKTEAQIILRWVTKRGVIPVTTSRRHDRIADAQNLFEFDLEDEEVTKITRLGLQHPPVRCYWKSQYDKFNAEAQK